jgi:hypothetical protein
LRKLEIVAKKERWRKSHANHLRFDCSDFLGWERFGGAAFKPAKSHRKSFTTGKR